MHKLMNNMIFKRIVAILLSIMCIYSLIDATVVYSRAATKLGTPAALGSPVLNTNTVADNWNKYEILVWGIFLSNFCKPLIDDYESAFNTNSVNGSKGSGVKAITFSSGGDLETSKTLQDLTTYAIEYQKKSARPIYVSYNVFDNFKYKSDNVFSKNTDDKKTDAGTEKDSSYTPAKRQATLDDLIFKEGAEDTKFEDSTWAYIGLAKEFSQNDDVGEKNAGKNKYSPMKAVKRASIPTFAIEANDTNAKWQIVLDYRSSYDSSLVSGALASGLSDEYRDKAVRTLTKQAGSVTDDKQTNSDSDENNTKNNDTETVDDGSTINKSPLYLDGFGNICVSTGGRYIVIIPASANQYTTKDNSINLVNSLMFNAGSSGTNSTDLILKGGNEIETNTGASSKNQSAQSGLLAFTNNSYAGQGGGMALFFDTDTIVRKQIKDVGSTKGDTTNQDIDIGKIYTKLFNADINSSASDIGFKIEPVNTSNKKIYKGFGGTNEKSVMNTFNTIASLSNTPVYSTTGVKRLSKLKDYTTGKDIELFKSSYVVPIDIPSGLDGSKLNIYAPLRGMLNYAYQVYNQNKEYRTTTTLYDSSGTGSKQIGTSKNDVVNALRNQSSLEVVNELTSKNNKPSNFLVNFIANNLGSERLGLYSSNNGTKLSVDVLDIEQKGGIMAGSLLAMYRVTPDDLVAAKFDNSPAAKIFRTGTSIDGEASNLFKRAVKIYSISPELEYVSNVLGVREGTEFATYATYIYLTYLDWYGLSGNTLSETAKSNLNMNIFSESSIPKNLDEITNSVKTKEQKEEEILEMTYLMLHPEDGKEYRNKIAMNNFETSVYEQYNRIVYGGASEYNYNLVTTRNNTGFLSVNNYSNNFLTKAFMNSYADLAIYLIGIGLIIVFVIGAIKKRKVTWFFLAMVFVVTVVVIIPSFGETVPYISNRVVQSMFKDKMTYWSLSEQIANAKNEEYIQSDTSSVTDEGSRAQILSLMSSVKSVYLDRYINIKQDISNKVTSSENAEWDKYQNIKSARWMLPMIMKQFTGDDGTSNYVYVALSDKLEDLSNMYWYYRPRDAAFSNSFNANSELSDKSTTIEPTTYDENAKGALDLTSRPIDLFGSYYDMSNTNINYRCIAYQRRGEQKYLPHTYFYLVDNLNDTCVITQDIADVIGTDSINNPKDWRSEAINTLVERNKGLQNFEVASNIIQTQGQTYNRYDRSSMNQIYGYLWSTESPLHYFYEVVKDSFPEDSSYSSIMGDIEGTYITTSDGAIVPGKEYRKSFMYDDETGEVRDILDLENMFRNMIPYMYSMQVIAGGEDGESGVFGDDKIEDYKVYKGVNNVSWLFRSNWVTKIMEGDYSESASINLADGTDKKVVNQLIPDFYEAAGREMVFSEAQKVTMGLHDSDLSLIELRCIELNNKVARQWTMMLNYVGQSGMSKEILTKQMAVEALLSFNNEFTPATKIGDNVKLYPDSLDLRSISFDSIMCMLMLNVTHDSSFIYGDTMRSIIASYDIITVLLLLLDAFLCALVIPFVRDVSLGLLFYLGFFALARTLFKDNRSKANVSLGYVTFHITYLIINIIYLWAFKIMMNMTVSDQVLSPNNFEVNSGNPIFVLIIVLLLDGLFIAVSFWVINVCIKNYKDMGYTIITETGKAISSYVSGGLEKLSNRLMEFAGGSGASSSGRGGNAKSYNDAKQKEKAKSAGNSKNGHGGSDGSSDNSNSGSSENQNNSNNDTVEQGETKQGYRANSKEQQQSSDPSSIDDKIERGKQSMKEKGNKKQGNASDTYMDTNKQSGNM